MRLLDLFCGRWGWSREFARRGLECIGVDLVLAVADYAERICERSPEKTGIREDLEAAKP